jgi:D-serine deaminase-like pyridoxal phosphate-dependent protein
LPHPARHSGKTLKLHGKTTKINPENKQLQISGSTQVTTVSQHNPLHKNPQA